MTDLWTWSVKERRSVVPHPWQAPPEEDARVQELGQEIEAINDDISDLEQEIESYERSIREAEREIERLQRRKQLLESEREKLALD